MRKDEARVIVYLLLILGVNCVLWADFLKHNGALFAPYFSFGIIFFLGIAFLFCFGSVVVAHSVFLKFWYLLGTFLFIPLVIVVYAYLYYSGNVCEACDSFSCVLNSPEESVYFSMVTFTTLGYGDIKPCGEARLVAASQAFFGFLLVPVIISQLVDLLKEVSIEFAD